MPHEGALTGDPSGAAYVETPEFYLRMGKSRRRVYLGVHGLGVTITGGCREKIIFPQIMWLLILSRSLATRVQLCPFPGNRHHLLLGSCIWLQLQLCLDGIR